MLFGDAHIEIACRKTVANSTIPEPSHIAGVMPDQPLVLRRHVAQPLPEYFGIGGFGGAVSRHDLGRVPMR